MITDTVHYILDGSTIVAETRKDEYGTVTHQFYYYYDENGAPVGLNWNGQDYHYYKNIFGDILGIFNSAGTLVVRYSYDAWGSHVSITGSMANTLGQYNPFRYRGYYYDNETGMYYLNARYYNPYWCRFISPDPVLDASNAVGCNLFAYCGNDPINKVDPSGQFALSVVGSIALYEIAVALLEVSVISILAIEVAKNPPKLPAFSQTWSKSVGWSKAKIKLQAITIPKSIELTDDTVIYRRGGSNPGSLTPNKKDLMVYKKTGLGLSFTLIPTQGSVKTTVGAVCSTGILYAVYDHDAHVSIHPVGGTIEDWYNAGAKSNWTTALKAIVKKY